MLDKDKIKDIEIFSKNLRLNALKMTSLGGSSHIASILSCADIISCLYVAILKIDPNNPNDHCRDRFILSKGHAGAAVYSALAQREFFSKDLLPLHYQNGSIFSGHVSHKGVPGVEFSTGSLGHGLPVACGMALALKLDDISSKVYCLLSDGECDEGSNWEAALFAPHHNLGNLIAIIDYNKYQSIKTTDETLSLEPFKEKWEAFGWEVREVDGHSVKELLDALSVDQQNHKPLCVIAHTIKGKGVSFMENNILWHYRSAQGEEYLLAKKELQNEG